MSWADPTTETYKHTTTFTGSDQFLATKATLQRVVGARVDQLVHLACRSQIIDKLRRGHASKDQYEGVCVRWVQVASCT